MVQVALKRWRWEERGRHGGAPSRWLIDDERDVQALLWTILKMRSGADQKNWTVKNRKAQ